MSNKCKKWLQISAMVVFGGGFASSVPAIDASCRNQSDTRFALVIGNSYAGRLSGPLDAEVIAGHLCQLGFSVDLLKDASFHQLEGNRNNQDDGALGDFRRRIAAAKEVVFFYSGHGYQIGGTNYLLPNDQDFNAADPQLPLSKVLRALQGAPDEAAKIVFLDACRTLAVPDGQLPDPGLAETHNLPPATLLSYAAEYGHTVPSGREDHLSPYAEALAKFIREPGLGIFQFLARVSLEVMDTQTPIYQLNNFPAFAFKEAIQLPVKVIDVADQLLIFHNGRLVRAASEEEDRNVAEAAAKPLELAAGDNELLVMMFNAKKFQDNQPWLPTDGWHYELKVDWPPNTQKNCGDPSPCFQGGERTPFKSGPHHGQLFEVARAKIHVDPNDWSVTATVDNQVWKTAPPLWSQEQDLLWFRSFDLLPLERRPALQELADLFEVVKELLTALHLTSAVDLPELRNLQAEVYGNGALKEPVRFCMEDQLEERLDSLEASVKSFLEGKDSRPFDSFDQGIAKCVGARVAQDPAHAFSGKEVRIWTALEELKPNGALRN